MRDPANMRDMTFEKGGRRAGAKVLLRRCEQGKGRNKFSRGRKVSPVNEGRGGKHSAAAPTFRIVGLLRAGRPARRGGGGGRRCRGRGAGSGGVVLVCIDLYIEIIKPIYEPIIRPIIKSGRSAVGGATLKILAEAGRV